MTGPAARAQAAYLRQELTAPAAALAEYARALAAKATHATPADEAELCARTADRADRLARLVAEVTAPDATAPADSNHWREVRHDLRACASFILMACEELTETAPAAAVLEPELTQTCSAAARALELIDQVVRFGQGGEPATSISDTVRDMLARLPQAAIHRPTVAGRILLVDDNEFGRDLLARMLVSQGHTVETADSGLAAQTRLTQPEPPVDLVLLDVMMPGMTGPELLIWLKADPNLWVLPVIMVSALGEDDSVLACIAAGAEDYLTRPVKPELLRARIAGSLEKKRLRDREASYQLRIDQLVRAIFPPAAVAEWQATGTIQPRTHEQVGVLFTDVVGFTTFAERYQNEPAHVVNLLQDLVTRFEATVARHGVQKIKTIGDAFMGVVGLASSVENPAARLTACALDLIADAAAHPAGWPIRVGIHIGPVVTGVLGKTQFSFDVWGHTVNAANRTESHGTPGRVTLSDEAWHRLNGTALGEPREVNARGLGLVRVWDFTRWLR